jgi:AcrR family transcriptional regulator
MRENIWSVDACTCTLVKVKAVTRTRARRGEGDRLRLELLEATVEEIAATGSIDNVSLRAVAKRVGVSPTAVYQHFPDRDALVEAAVIQCWEDFRAALAVAFDEEDPYQRLRLGGEIYARFAIDHPRQYAVMIGETERLPNAGSVGTLAFEDLVRMVTAILDAKGDDRDPVYVSTLVHTWTHGIVTLAACAPELPWPDLDTLLDEVMLRLGLTREA